MTKSVLLRVDPLTFPWATLDPFLFCAYHDDAYPAGNANLGPAASLAGRDIGQDFAGKDGWRMYHGDVVPGFPQHPHRGFETVTIVRRGTVDHADSLKATARFAAGDVQWVTAGGGISHSEMFPLLDRTAANPLELFQIWLNLPAVEKMAPAHFSMFWREDVPMVTVNDAHGASTRVTVIAGTLNDTLALTPPPHSWAARPDSGVAIWTVEMAAGAQWTLPSAADAGLSRALYAFRGEDLRVAGVSVGSSVRMILAADMPVVLDAGPAGASLLVLQGRPIGEPVVQHGPFVLTNERDLRQAFVDYQRTQFGGWPWPSDAPVHGAEAGRFARHADGRVEQPGSSESAAPERDLPR